MTGKVLTVLRKIEEGILVIMLAIMSLAAIAQVLNRNIFMLPITWLEELARYCMVYMTVFAAEVGLRDGTQISVETAVGRNKYVKIIANAILCAFAMVVFYYAVILFKNQVQRGQLTPSLHIPMSIPYFSMVIGFGCISVTQLVSLIQKIAHLKKADESCSCVGGEK